MSTKRSYASGTTVTATRTEAEIKDLLASRGVEKIITASQPGEYTMMFEYQGVPHKMRLPLPDPSEERFTSYFRSGVRYSRTEAASRELFDAEINRRWRALGAVVKAKIVAVEEGITTMDAMFVGEAMTNTGRTVAEEFGPQIRALAGTGRLPALELPYRAGGDK
jgi:hypothetical protein